ncbi:MAG: glycosyltransferase, partial [Bacteroidota bacterium]|nr:glycosyltransferase [Bacteroidota bacterium]
IHRNMMKKDSACWIPDYPGENNLSGDLGHKFKAPLKTFFVGPLSRFAGPNGKSEGEHDNYKSDVLAIISGPEPQRTILEKLILNQLKGLELKATVLLGLPEKQIAYQLDDHIRVFSHLDTPTFRKYILGAQHIICRPGYSGIMDLFALGRKAILIPTPGQTEQEYLAAHLSKYQFVCKKQDHFLLRNAILEDSEKTWHNSIDDDVLLDQALSQLIDNI